MIRKIAKNLGATQTIIQSDDRIQIKMENAVSTHTTSMFFGADYSEFMHPKGGKMKQKCWFDRTNAGAAGQPPVVYKQSSMKLEKPITRTESTAVVTHDAASGIATLTYTMECYGESDDKVLVKCKRIFTRKVAPPKAAAAGSAAAAPKT